jgi:hypothetical protein
MCAWRYDGGLSCAIGSKTEPMGCPSSAELSAVSIKISHCVEREFLDLFRADLAAGTTTINILSPFVSPNRSSNYYAVLSALNVRSVSVNLYVRPQSEQPDSLRPSYPEAIRHLEVRGAKVFQRSGMHEKVASIDQHVLWHGSLNILSHNDSRESMLRFESSELVREVLRDIGIPEFSYEESSDKNVASHQPSEMRAAPICALCGSPMQLFENAGIWVCSNSPKCPGVRSVGAVETEEEAQTFESTLDLDCPICGSPMVVSGALRRRIVCPAQSCGFSLEPRLSAGILRILSRRQAV